MPAHVLEVNPAQLLRDLKLGEPRGIRAPRWSVHVWRAVFVVCLPTLPVLEHQGLEKARALHLRGPCTMSD